MAKRKMRGTPVRLANDREAIAEGRRRFLGAMGISAGWARLGAGLGSSRLAAQNAGAPNGGAPNAGQGAAGSGGPPGGPRTGPSMPPAPKVPQPPPLKDVAGKTAYITAASDG